nr:copia protein [Tanacetum cinerariifolium]
MLSACNNFKIDSQNVYSKVVCAMCKQCLISVNHDVCLRNFVKGKTSCGKKQKAHVSIKENQKKHQPKGSITEFVYLVEAHHHLNPIFIPKDNSPRRLDDGVVMIVLEARGSPLRFSEVHLSLVALNPKLEVFYALSYNQLSGPLVDGRSENLLVFRWQVVQVTLKGLLNALKIIVECFKEWNDLLEPPGSNHGRNQYIVYLLNLKGYPDLFMCVDSGCSKHMIGNLKLIINFVWKFMGTVRFGNDHVAAILGQFCDSDLEVAFRRNACFVRNLEGVDLLKGYRSTNLYKTNLHEMSSASPICLMARASSTKSWLWHQRLSHLNFDTINDLTRNDLVSGLPKFKYLKEHLCPSLERRNRTLVETARTMLIFSRAPLFLWAEAIATACFTQNRSIIHYCFNKTPYELINGKKQDISFLYVFGALCYPKNDRGDIEKLGAKGDIGFFIGYSADSCAYREYNQRKKKIIETMNVSFDELSAMAFEQRSSKLGIQSELDLLFETMYDDYIGGQLSATARTDTAAQEPQVRQTTTTSTTIADTAPTPKNSSFHATNIPITSQDVDELNPNALFDGNSFVNPFATSSTSFIDYDHPSHVYKLKKALYGLKQAPRAWYDELSTFLLQNHFFKGTINLTLFIRRFHDDILVVQVYVDDIIFGSINHRYIQLFFDLMKSRFEMSMMGEMTFFLCLQVNQSPCGIFINQSKYVLEILKRYGMKSCDTVGTLMEIKDKLDLDQNGTPIDATKYRSMIGSLMYLMSSRPDIVHATCLCARCQAKPTDKHLKEVKRIFRYLRGTINTGLWYTKDSGFELTGFSDADYTGCKDTFKSTSGGSQFLGEKLVSWSSKKQDCTTLSTAKAEYVSLSACCTQVLWIRTQLTDYGFHFNKILIYCDSKSAIAISCNPVQHSRTKHIDVRYHFIKEHVEKGTIELYFVKTDYQLADLFTKALPADRFNYQVCRLGMRSLSPQELDRLAKSQ